MRPTPALVTVAAVAAVAVATLVAAAAPNGGRAYRNEGARVRSFEAPLGWQAAPQASYPRLLCAYSHPDGGKLTLVAQKVAPGTSADSLAAQAVPALEKQGFFEIRRAPDLKDGARARLEAKLDGGRRFIKQLYVVDGGAGWVLTVAGDTVKQPLLARDFETAAHSLQIAPAAASDGGAS